MDDGGSQIVAGLILLTIFLVLEFILTAFLSALDTVSESDIKEKDGTKAEWLLKIRDNPKSMINTFHVTIVFFAAFLGCFAAYGAAEFWRGELHIPVLICELAIAVFLFVVLGIQFPRALGTYKGKEILFRLAVPAKVLLFLFYPIAAFIQGCVYLLALPFGVNTKEMPEDVTEEEIISMVNEGHEQGVLEANEAEMITNIVEFGDKEAQDVMTHRTNIVGVDGKINLKSAIQFMLDATNSRFPVYEEGMDNITGIIHLKDAMRCHTAGNYDEWLIKDIPGLIRQAVFIPKTRKINLLFKNMQSKKLQMVIVADEYGQTAGLVDRKSVV